MLPPPLFCLCLTLRCCCVSTHAVGSEVVLLLAAPRQLLLLLPLVTHGCLVTSNRLGSFTPCFCVQRVCGAAGGGALQC